MPRVFENIARVARNMATMNVLNRSVDGGVNGARIVSAIAAPVPKIQSAGVEPR